MYTSPDLLQWLSRAICCPEVPRGETLQTPALGRCDPAGSSPCSLSRSLKSQSIPADEHTRTQIAAAPCLPFRIPRSTATSPRACKSGVVALEPQKKIVFCSDGAEKITGYATNRCPLPLLR